MVMFVNSLKLTNIASIGVQILDLQTVEHNRQARTVNKYHKVRPAFSSLAIFPHAVLLPIAQNEISRKDDNLIASF